MCVSTYEHILIRIFVWVLATLVYMELVVTTVPTCEFVFYCSILYTLGETNVRVALSDNVFCFELPKFSHEITIIANSINLSQ